MIKSRKTYELVQGDGNKLHKVVIESEPCALGSELSRFIQNSLFKIIASNPELTLCQGLVFQNLSMRHDAEKWIVTLTAIEEVSQS